MYTYRDIANANLTAGDIIATLKTAALELSKEHPEELELMYTLAKTDTLEEDWRRGRYLSFMRQLYAIWWEMPQKYCGPYRTQIEEAMDKLNENDLLFEVMSSRSDASFSESGNLFKLGKLLADLNHADDLMNDDVIDYEEIDNSLLNNVDFGKILMDLYPSWFDLDSKLRACVGFLASSYLGGDINFGLICFNKGLLGKMSIAIELADYLLDYEEAVATAGIEDEELLTGIDELHNAFQEIGAFDRWRKF
jgi:hypothetical protein